MMEDKKEKRGIAPAGNEGGDKKIPPLSEARMPESPDKEKVQKERMPPARDVLG